MVDFTAMMLPDFDPAVVPAEQIPATLSQLAAWQSQLAARLVAAAPSAAVVVDVRLLTIEEAATKLGVTNEWLYRRSKRLGLAVKLGDGTLRFSSTSLDTYIKNQTVSAAPIRRRRVS